MAAKRLKKIFAAPLISIVILFSTGLVTPATAAPYGACTYSSGTFDQNSTCDQPSNGENLSETGDNQDHILAIAGLILGVSGMALFAYLFIRSRSKKNLAK
jgi:LPXTG-motif cell wall-anchored protein